MDTLFKILVLIFVTALGFFLVPLMVNILIKVDLLDTATVTQDFVKEMVRNSTYIWMGTIVLGIVSLFIKQSWRIALLLCPLILPSLYLVIYAISQT